VIAVTGAAGFIGGAIARTLDSAGADVLAIDAAEKTDFVGDQEFLDKDEFLRRVTGNLPLPTIDAVVHQGACADTTLRDVDFMRRENCVYALAVLRFCLAHRIPFLYASSAAVYGRARSFQEEGVFGAGLTEYAYSKALLDSNVRRLLPGAHSQVAGLRYFNVYGPGEERKGPMASMVLRLWRQLERSGTMRLFDASHGYAAGEQRRDFVAVEDVVAVNLWFLEHPDRSGIFNVGSGESRSFNDVARVLASMHGGGKIEYVAMPESLRPRYQAFTRADLRELRAVGFRRPFRSLDVGVIAYISQLRAAAAA
jgi:ADP-L-glycero-D-manno-heptose 6-epimerase